MRRYCRDTCMHLTLLWGFHNHMFTSTLKNSVSAYALRSTCGSLGPSDPVTHIAGHHAKKSDMRKKTESIGMHGHRHRARCAVHRTMSRRHQTRSQLLEATSCHIVLMEQAAPCDPLRTCVIRTSNPLRSQRWPTAIHHNETLHTDAVEQRWGPDLTSPTGFVRAQAARSEVPEPSQINTLPYIGRDAPD